ncbi:hypothetical protein K504DRAFT_484733 [Pleomassaria siparia CBS 279.74]|uniref:Nudix hydrolase domain-containing protein n=1 Tax=Pleomassaria siparia CBS 279.74 TaxID=1314801 RepID=A0A6G1JWS5_9PLEO|nr:hypothetical protein K504DRAFT_484733 [Pleomassaria siparia CBS 279.74]
MCYTSLILQDEPKHQVVHLHGGRVAFLMILRPKDSRFERYVILIEQPRTGARSTSFLEIPAGMLDDSDEVKGQAIKEIQEETNLKISKEDLIDMTKLAFEKTGTGLDENIPLLLWEKDLDRKEIESLKGRLTGERTQDERTTPRICDYEDLWKEGARDSKALAARALYEGLHRTGRIEDELLKVRQGRLGRLR